MRRLSFQAIGSFAVATVALAGCQTTGDETLSRVAVTELPLRLGHFANLNPDCSPIGNPEVRVTKPAEHGIVTVQPGEGYTNFVQTNLRNHCNYRPTAGVNAVYTSKRGYAGPDTTVLDVIYPTGQERQFSYSLNVK